MAITFQRDIIPNSLPLPWNNAFHPLVKGEECISRWHPILYFIDAVGFETWLDRAAKFYADGLSLLEVIAKQIVDPKDGRV